MIAPPSPGTLSLPIKSVVVVAGVDVAVWGLGVIGWLPLAWSLATVGIVTFLGILLFAQALTEAKTTRAGSTPKEGFDKSVVQLAITAAVLAVYFALAPVLIFQGVTPSDPTMANVVIGQMSTILEVVVGFYMGTAVIGYSAKVWGIAKAPNPQQATLVANS